MYCILYHTFYITIYNTIYITNSINIFNPQSTFLPQRDGPTTSRQPADPPTALLNG
jgi:hypothetical protein